MEEVEPIVTLVSSEGVPFELPRKVAYYSSTIESLFESKPGKFHAPILLLSRINLGEEEDGWSLDEGWCFYAEQRISMLNAFSPIQLSSKFHFHHTYCSFITLPITY